MPVARIVKITIPAPTLTASTPACFTEARVADVLAAAKPEDAVTVVNLLSLVAPAERELVFDWLAQLFPPPSAVEKRSVVSGDPRAIGQWRDTVVESWMTGGTQGPL